MSLFGRRTSFGGGGAIGFDTPLAHPLPKIVTPQPVKPGFLAGELSWHRIWAARWWVVLALVACYVAGLSVNRGPSMNGLGWVYLHSWGTQPIQDGDIFVFVPADKPAWMKYVPGQQWIKRRVGVTTDGRYIFEGDNENWSADNRDSMKPVPPDHVAGVVFAAISPKRIANYFTAQGRVRNWADFSGPQHRQQWSPDGRYVVINSGSHFRMFYGMQEVASGAGRCCRWDGDKALIVSRDATYPADEKLRYVATDGTSAPSLPWGKTRNGFRIVSASPSSLRNPNNVFDGYDNTMWGIESSGPRNVRLLAEVAPRRVSKLVMVSYPSTSGSAIILRVNGRLAHPKSKGMYPGDVEDIAFGNYRIISEVSLGIMVRTIEVEIRGGGNRVAINEIRLE